MLPVFEWYVGLGWKVFPLRRFTKFPAVNDWPNVATTDMARIRDWLAYDPLAGVGIPTGSVNRLLVVDRDVRNGIDGYRSLIEEEDASGDVLPRAPRVRTPSVGSHLYYRLDEPCPSANGWLEGVDIKADGGYVVGAGSAIAYHGSESWTSDPGVSYRDYELESGDLTVLAETPRWLLDSVRANGGRFRTAAGSSSQMTASVLTTEDAIRDGLPEGDRNESMHWLLCHWWAHFGTDNLNAVMNIARMVWLQTPNHQTFPWSHVEYMLPRARAFVLHEDSKRQSIARQLVRS